MGHCQGRTPKLLNEEAQTTAVRALPQDLSEVCRWRQGGRDTGSGVLEKINSGHPVRSALQIHEK
jgi:hypothetical protein